MEKENDNHQSKQQLMLEEEQIKAAQKNSLLFEPIYNKYYENIVRFIYQRVNTKEEAFDITSQVFYKCMLNLKKYEFRGIPFSAWLYRIALNELNMLYRNNKIEKVLNIDNAGLNNLITEVQEEDNEAKHNAIAQAIALLAEDEVHLIEMRFFEKRSFNEMGHILNITENNAKVRLYRCLDKVKQIINAKN
jgi:RNA polymerase sigma-70 factor (ECF subfamily)